MGSGEGKSPLALLCMVQRRSCLLLSSRQWTWQCVTDLWEWFCAKLAHMKPSCFNQRSWLVYQQQELWKLWQMCRISVPWHTYKIHKYFHSNYVSSETSNHGPGLDVFKRAWGWCSWTSRIEMDPQIDKLDFQLLNDCDMVWMDWITSWGLGSFWYSPNTLQRVDWLPRC